MSYAFVVRRTLVNCVAELRSMYTIRTWLFGWLSRLVAQVAFFALIGLALDSPDLTRYLAIGNAVVLACIEATIVVRSVNDERAHRTLSLLVATPIGHTVVLLTRGLQWTVTGMVSSTIALVVIPALLGAPLSGAELLVAVPMMWVICLTSYCYGCALCGVVLRHPRLDWLVLNIGYLAVMTFAGVNVPVTFWPSWMAWLPNVLPVTHGLLGIRAVIDGAQGAPTLLGLELLVGACWLVLGVVSVRRFVNRGLRTGGIDFG